ncbi:uncharacterized protein [Palaemon carinicauda]|uniref:uncharacterized protein n=1 Tax=Palaemon carinicauda TaxID=392227 RepID=UPI0035B5865E
MSKTSPSSPEPKRLASKPTMSSSHLPSSDTNAKNNSNAGSLSHSIISIQNLMSSSSSSSSSPSSLPLMPSDATSEKSLATAALHSSPSSSPTMTSVRIYPLGPLSSHDPARSSEVSPSDDISLSSSSFSAAALAAAPLFPTATTASSLMALVSTTASSPGPPVQAFPSGTAPSSSFKSIASLSSSSSNSSSSSSSFAHVLSNTLPVFSQSFNLSTASSRQSGCIVPTAMTPALVNSSPSIAPSSASSHSPPTDSNNIYDPSSPASHNIIE